MPKKQVYECLSGDYAIVKKGEKIYLDGINATNEAGDGLDIDINHLTTSDDFLCLTDKESMKKTVKKNKTDDSKSGGSLYCIVSEINKQFSSIDDAVKEIGKVGKSAYICKMCSKVDIEIKTKVTNLGGADGND